MAEGLPVRAPRIPSSDSPAAHYRDELLRGRVYLDRLRVHHLDLAGRFLAAADGAVYTIDLVIGAAMSRSYSLVDGFISAFDDWNPVVAAPLVRMQIDSLVRLAYVANAPSADEIADHADHVIKGGEFRGLKDASGKPLTDARLIEHASAVDPWVRDVYSATSGWIHFSPEHVRAKWRINEVDDARSGTQNRLSGTLPLRAEDIP